MSVKIDYQLLLERPPVPPLSLDARESLRGQRVLITGAGGTIGGEIARLASGCEPGALLLMDRSEPALFWAMQDLRLRCRCEGSLVDVSHYGRIVDRMRSWQPDVVFHAAAHKHVPLLEDHREDAFFNNVMGTAGVVDGAVIGGCRRIVLVSTDKAVAPANVMGTTKRLAELYLQHKSEVVSDLIASSVRFGNVVGSSGSVVETWERQAEHGGPLTVTDPRMTRYFIGLGDAARLVIEAGAMNPGGMFMLDMGQPYNIETLAFRFASLTGVKSSPQVVFTGIRPGEKIDEEIAWSNERLSDTSVPGVLRVSRAAEPIPQ